MATKKSNPALEMILNFKCKQDSSGQTLNHQAVVSCLVRTKISKN